MLDENQAEPAVVPESSRRPNPRLALAVWLLLLILPGIGGLLLHLQDMSALVALAGLFIAAQAADVDPQWFALNSVLSRVVPVGGCAAFTLLAVIVFQGDAPPAPRYAATAFCVAAALFALLTLSARVERWLVRLLFRGPDDSSTLRLTAQIVALTLLVSLPGALVFQPLMDSLLDTPELFIASRVLGGELIGYLTLTLAGVGFLVRRDARQTAERLGLRPLGVRELGFVVLGAAALLVINSGAEWIQRLAFPALLAHDRHVNQALVEGLSAQQAMLLGVTAGIGEELTMRGALQPKLGLVLTSVLFASLHVQYSWYGMLAVMVIGMVLGLLRQRSSTTVCIAVHALYDMIAIFST